MKSEPFAGNVGQMKTDARWLASEDIIGLGEIKLTINGVVRNEDVPMDGGRKEKLLFSLRFDRSEKQMILNATNRKTLAAAFGADTKKWVGQEVVVYVLDGIRKPGGRAGETTTGLRLRAANPKANPLLPQ